MKKLLTKYNRITVSVLTDRVMQQVSILGNILKQKWFWHKRQCMSLWRDDKTGLNMMALWPVVSCLEINFTTECWFWRTVAWAFIRHHVIFESLVRFWEQNLAVRWLASYCDLLPLLVSSSHPEEHCTPHTETDSLTLFPEHIRIRCL
jgi:hypothetical protein